MAILQHLTLVFSAALCLCSLIGAAAGMWEA